MNGNLLLYWMSRLGDGSWRRFAETLEELGPDGDQDRLKRKLVVSLSDLAHADFSRRTRKWKVRGPVLAGLIGVRGRAILCGARSERLVQSVRQAAHKVACEYHEQPEQDAPSGIFVNGDEQMLFSVEHSTGVHFLADYSLHLLASAAPVMKKYEIAQLERGILNWAVSVFDFETLKWTLLTERLSMGDQLPSNSALEFKSDYERKYCVTGLQTGPRKLPRREAVYVAASLKHRPLVNYDPQRCVLSTPLTAPLPEAYTRMACLCSGSPARVEAGKLVYQKVPPSIALPIITLAGQRHPGFVST